MSRFRLLSALALSAAALATLVFPRSSAEAQDTPDLKQNWSAADIEGWYSASQGSRLIPLSWFKALEQPGSTAPFGSREHIERFRYLPTEDGLAVGFAVDTMDDDALSVTRLRWKSGQGSKEPWLGMNCAACHTAEITYGSTRLRVEGGPTLADFQGFIESLNAALVETRDDAEKFARFAAGVLGAADSELNRESLRASLGQLIAWQTSVERMNATDLRYGYGRLDAFGHIFNKVALVADPTKLEPNPSDAPVSYPFLWNVPQHDRVQWNGIAPNKLLPHLWFSQPFDIGALARNTGEVIGVFADIKPKADAGLSGYVSSLNVSNIVSFEQLLARLMPPLWPDDVFGAPNPELVATGAELFEANCASCHKVLARTDLTTPIIAQIDLFNGASGPPPGTDPWMACNAYTYTAPTGVLEGTPRDYAFGPPLGAVAPLADMLTTTVAGTLVSDIGEVIESVADSFFGRHPPPTLATPPDISLFGTPIDILTAREKRLHRCMTEASPILGYKARPLTGIWATGPYLHNGSVPTLYDLLLPPEERPTSFWTGSREFDPAKVGFVSTQSADNTFLFRSHDDSGRVIEGNSNAGHDYDNSGFSDEDRKALVEYMKTL